MVERILGIDLGIASLGWAVVEYDKNNDGNNKIVDCGVRLFTAAETPKEKESPNKARREARGIRRVIKRRRVRMNEIKKLCIQRGILTYDDIDRTNGIFNAPKTENPNASRIDVWQLRHDALNRNLHNEEFARILIHIAKHRGYKFIGVDDSDEESGKVKKAGAELKANFESAGCRTVGEWLWNERLHHGRKRNKSGDYEISIHRDFLTAEIDAIFIAQQSFGNSYATNEFRDTYKNIAFFVRPMKSIEHMVGTCTYFPNEKRAPKASPTAERFVALGKFFNTVIIDPDKTERKLIEFKSIDDLMDFSITKEKIDYKQLRKFLGLSDQQIFKGLNYKSNKSDSTEWGKVIKETETRSWIGLKGHIALKTALGEEKFAAFIRDIDTADEAVKILTYFKDPRQKRDALARLSLHPGMIDPLSQLSFSDFNQLSLKAMRILNPIIEGGYQRYDEAVRHAFENGLFPPKKDQKSEFLPPLKDTDIDILNPTVIRAFAQFRKVANALVKKYGSFDKVHFELAREVNTKADIKGMIEGQRKNEKEREAAKVWISENFGSVVLITRKNILKKRLYEQQDGRCIYTGEVIHLERLFDEGYCEIDHILPRSRSADDSFANKVLVLSKANQDKSNQTPFEWLGHNTEKWGRFEAYLSSPTLRAKLGMGKINRLLKKNFDENSEKEFLSRNLNDTRYMARAIKTYCENYWKLTHEDDKLRIQVRSGKLTSALRHQWGLDFKNRDTHTHHAADAIMIAFSTQGMVKRLSDYYALKETHREKTKPEFKPPMEHFREAVENATAVERTETITARDGREITLNRLLISRPPRAGVTGAAHKETIQSPSDYKGRGVAVNRGKGMCDNGDMPRVDVFTKGGKYYLVPIYVADFAKKELPNKAIVAQKSSDEWDEMDMSFQFLFSLHKEDMIEIKTKKTPARPSITALGYFNSAHSGTAQIIIGSPDNSENDIFCRDKNKDGTPKGDSIARYGSKTLVYIKKYTIDPLGYYHEVKGEKRLGTIPQERKKGRGSQGN